jgi:hypothetical protein
MGHSDPGKGGNFWKPPDLPNLKRYMNNLIDLEIARQRRVLARIRANQGPWWNTWFLPRGEDLEGLTPEELRRGSLWGPAVDRGRLNGADLALLGLN